MIMRPGASLAFSLWLAILSSGGAGCASGQFAPAQTPAVGVQAPARAAASLDLRLPNKRGTVKFGVIGDNGTGEREQYDIAERMAAFHGIFPFEFVIMLGDNMYGSQNPRDFER